MIFTITTVDPVIVCICLVSVHVMELDVSNLILVRYGTLFLKKKLKSIHLKRYILMMWSYKFLAIHCAVTDMWHILLIHGMSCLVFVHEVARLMGISLFWQPATFYSECIVMPKCWVDSGLTKFSLSRSYDYMDCGGSVLLFQCLGDRRPEGTLNYAHSLFVSVIAVCVHWNLVLYLYWFSVAYADGLGVQTLLRVKNFKTKL